jgi:hypothetical protein
LTRRALALAVAFLAVGEQCRHRLHNAPCEQPRLPCLLASSSMRETETMLV